MNESDDYVTIDLVMFGASQAGKTAILQRFLENKFENRYVETVEDVYKKGFSIRNRTVLVHFLDLGGANEFPAMRRIHVNKANAFLLVCAADIDDSFDKLQSCWAEVVAAKRAPGQLAKVPFVVVLTKGDMVMEDNKHLAAKQALADRIDEWLDKIVAADNSRKKDLLFAEVSSKSGFGITKPFIQLADQFLPADEVLPNPDTSAPISASSDSTAGTQQQGKRGFSLYRRKDKPPKIDNTAQTKLDRSQTLSKSFKNKPLKQTDIPCEDDCNLQ